MQEVSSAKIDNMTRNVKQNISKEDSHMCEMDWEITA